MKRIQLTQETKARLQRFYAEERAHIKERGRGDQYMTRPEQYALVKGWLAMGGINNVHICTNAKWLPDFKVQFDVLYEHHTRLTCRLLRIEVDRNGTLEIKSDKRKHFEELLRGKPWSQPVVTVDQL